MSIQNGQFGDDSKHADSSWSEILETVKTEQQGANTENFDKKAWDVKIACSKKVLDIFENAGGKTNEQLFDELNTVIESLTSGLSQKEKKALREVETLTVAIQKQRDIWEMEDALKNNNADEDTDFEKLNQEVDALKSMESEILHLKQAHGKVELITHLQSRLGVFAQKMKTIEDFKKYGPGSVDVPETIQNVIENIRHKILYSNFGIHFIVRDKDWPTESGNAQGQYFGDTPFTINKHRINKGKRVGEILEHEGRHNIFNTIIGQQKIPLVRHLGGLNSLIQQHDKLTSLKAPNLIIGDAKKNIISRVSAMAHIHINENKDEILANFEGLAKGMASTDVNKYHKDRDILQKLRNDYEKKGKSLELIDMAIQIFEDEMKQFYQKMSEYLFIASRTGNLQKIRLLVYWIDLEKYSTIESYLRSEVGNDTYEACVAMRNIVDPLGIESLVTGEKLQKSLKPDEMLLRLIFGFGKMSENKFFTKAILRENIPSLLLYLKKYRTLDPEKQFRDNDHLRAFEGYTLTNKIRQLKIPSHLPKNSEIIEQERRLADLVALQNALKRYRRKPRVRKEI